MQGWLRCLRPSEALTDAANSEEQEARAAEEQARLAESLLQAVQEKSSSRYFQLLEARADVNFSFPPQQEGEPEKPTPLLAAIQHGSDAWVTLLLKADVEVNPTDMSRPQPLMQAATLGHASIVRILVEARADVNAIWTEGEVRACAVALAIRLNQAEMLQVLVDAAADFASAKEVLGCPLVIEAAKQNSAAALSLLLQLDFANNLDELHDGKTALEHAVLCDSPDAVKLLFERSMSGPMDGARLLKEATVCNNARALGVLLKLKADPNQVPVGDENAVPPLLDAVRSNSIACLELLLQARAQVDAVTASGSPAVLVATQENRLSALRLLLDAMADPNPVSTESPMCRATTAPDDRALRLLLKARGEVNRSSKGGEAGGGSTPMALAVHGRRPSQLRLLLDAGGDANSNVGEGWPAVSVAALHAEEEVLELLLGARADPNQPEVHAEARPLYVAAKSGQPIIMQLLLEANGDPNLLAKAGSTHLFHAARSGEAEALRRLLKARADVEVKTRKGHLPLVAAATKGQVACIEALIEGRANPNDCSTDGTSAVAAAATNGHAEALCALISAGGDPASAKAAAAPGHVP
mmetsp:Transcript_13031/g.30447  ORF Transcript_13031/g.30447 Transcript_13031/m.30447 type:complete len:585 (-) Transcript_13031:171-1925(-)